MSGGGGGGGEIPAKGLQLGQFLQIAFERAVAEGRSDFTNVISEMSPSFGKGSGNPWDRGIILCSGFDKN